MYAIRSYYEQVNIGEIEIVNVDGPDYMELSNFKVSIWDRAGGSKVWEKDYFATGSVGQGASFKVLGSVITSYSIHYMKLYEICIWGWMQG